MQRTGDHQSIWDASVTFYPLLAVILSVTVLASCLSLSERGDLIRQGLFKNLLPPVHQQLITAAAIWPRK